MKQLKTEKEKIRFTGVNMTFAIVVLFLLGIGIIMMFSASYAIAINEGKPGYYYAQRQAIFGAAGLVCMTAASFVDYHKLQNFWIIAAAYGGSVILLILVKIIGTDLGTGCTRWIRLPGGLTFQPSELAKFAIVISFAYLIDINFDRMDKFKYGTMPFMCLLGVIAVLLMIEPHLSCTLLIAAMGVILMFIGGSKFKHLALTAGAGLLVIIGWVVLKVVTGTQTYFLKRLQPWFHPFESDDAYQTQQSLIAIGSGGIFGLGMGESRQKYLYLPESENDFVFSIICEELGFVGAVTVILLFVLLVAQGFRIATHSKDRFGMLVACGFTLQIGLQAFINIGVVSNLLPNTGISLPFFSYGGTALMMQLVEMGIVLNISRGRYVVSKENSSHKKPEVKEAVS